MDESAIAARRFLPPRLLAKADQFPAAHIGIQVFRHIWHCLTSRILGNCLSRPNV